ASDGGMSVRFGDHTLRIDDSLLEARPGLRDYVGREVVLGIRPEDIEDAAVAADAPADRRLTVSADIREDMGSEVFLHFSVQAPPVRTQELVEALEEEAVEALEQRARLTGVPFVGRLDRTTRAREGEPIELAVDTRHLHFFDEESGAGIY